MLPRGYFNQPKPLRDARYNLRINSFSLLGRQADTILDMETLYQFETSSSETAAILLSLELPIFEIVRDGTIRTYKVNGFHPPSWLTDEELDEWFD